VLRKIASVLKSAVRAGDIVCRYGGEEFGVLLPHLDIEKAHQAAERYRQAVCDTPFSNLTVTASFGVSTSDLHAESFQELIDQADKCLYVAKRNGRNRVCRWDDVPDDVEAGETVVADVLPLKTVDVAIPFHAVTALISALSYRDTGTAEHSRRVADLCVRLAGQSMSIGEAYVLETAALLHDIGKNRCTRFDSAQARTTHQRGMAGDADPRGVTDIADVAQQLQQQANEDSDQMKLAELTSDLLDLCRSTQTAYLGDSAEEDEDEEEMLATSAVE
jgi:HD superfamily phosphohydrolase YqeK